MAHVPTPINEPVLDHAPGSREREELSAELRKVASDAVEIPVFAAGEAIRTGEKAGEP